MRTTTWINADNKKPNDQIFQILYFLLLFLAGDSNFIRLFIQADFFGPTKKFIFFQGMDIFEDPGGHVIRLFVVNHAHNVESVEIFEYTHQEPTQIVHKRTIVDDKFICINDVAAVDSERFYVTNLHKYCKIAHIMMTVELLFMGPLKTASVVYYDSNNSSFVARGAGMNGLTLSRDKRHLLVVHGDRDVQVYARNPSDGMLTYVRNFVIGQPSDNIFLDKQTGEYEYTLFFIPT